MWFDKLETVQSTYSTVQFLYKTPHLQQGFDITQSCFGSQIFYHGILQRNYRKMTINGHFPIIPL